MFLIKFMKITWTQDTCRFASGEIAYLGKWCVAGIHYDGATNDKEKYGISIYLPGIKSQQNQPSAEEAKARVEKIVAYWFAKAEK
jgi:hypothetical protein